MIKRGLRKRRCQGNVASFVDKLSKILETPAYADIIDWTADGEAFSIKNVTRLTEEVLPVFFKHRNFSSFIRQLNMYNFNKVRSAEDEHVYMNEHFRKSARNDFRNIKRRTAEDRDEFDYYDGGRTDQLASQLAQMARKQKDLELVIKHLAADNQSLRTENNKLWKRVERNIEKSDKKVEKLMLFMLFGNQSQEEDGEQLRINSSGKLEIQNDPTLKTPKQALASNLISMLRNQRESDDLRHFLQGYNIGRQPSQSKREDKKQAEITAQTPLDTLHNIEGSPGLIDDVNLFLNVEIPPSGDQFSLI